MKNISHNIIILKLWLIALGFLQLAQAQVSTPPLPPGSHNLNNNQGFGVPHFLELNNQTIATGDTLCFNATQTIYIEDFTVETGGNAKFICGHSIVFLPGVVIHAGANLQAFVSSNGQYCTPGNTEVTALEPEIEALAQPFQNDLFQISLSGKTLHIINTESRQAFLMLSNITGQEIIRKEIAGGVATRIETNLKTGIYIIKIISNKTIIDKKIFIL